MNNLDKQYKELLNHILANGKVKSDRTGTGTISVFDYTIRHKMEEGFPLLTTKKMFTKGIIHEAIWFLKGETNIKYLVDNGVHIWNNDCYNFYCKNINDKSLIHSKEVFIDLIKNDPEFAKEYGDLGPVYGAQWRNWNGEIDQIFNLVHELKNNPDSRRLLVSAWNVSVLNEIALPSCHYVFQCYTEKMTLEERIKYWCNSIGKSIHYGEDFYHEQLDILRVPSRKLSLKWSQRSVDVGLGICFNLASYGLILSLLAKEVNMVPNELIFSGGDCHIYKNHIEGLKKQLTQESYPLSTLVLNNNSIFDVKYEDIQILNYQSSAPIKLDLSN